MKKEKKKRCNDFKPATAKMKITKVRDEEKNVGIPDLRHNRYDQTSLPRAGSRAAGSI